MKKDNAARYAKDPEADNARSRAWHGRNRDRAIARGKENYRANFERYAAQRKAHHEANRESNLAYLKQWHIAHREIANAGRREWYHAHRDQANAARRRYHILHLDAERDTQKRIRLRVKYDTPWVNLFRAAQFRAKSKSLPFDLTSQWVENRWTGRCELSGIPFVLKNGAPGPKFYSPSLDRVIPSLGYIQTNCRIVLWAVNALKHDGTDADMYSVAKALTLNAP